MEGILKTLRTNEKVIFTSGLQKVVDFCRRVKICGHLFIHYYFTLRLIIGQPIPLVLFDYRFVNGVYQLLVGRKWSNITLFDEALVAHIKTSFDEFKLLVPNALCPLMTPMVSRKSPVAFSGILASISRQYASSMIGHVVEDFEQIYISYLQARLSRLVPVCITLVVVYDTFSWHSLFLSLVGFEIQSRCSLCQLYL
jgi:hypothetical protein